MANLFLFLKDKLHSICFEWFMSPTLERLEGRNKFLFHKHLFVSELNSLNMPSLIVRMLSSRKNYQLIFWCENIVSAISINGN